MAKRLSNHDVVIGPAIRDLAGVRHFYNGKHKMNRRSNASEDFGQFADFVDKFVLKGELDKIYHSDKNSLNVVPFSKLKEN